MRRDVCFNFPTTEILFFLGLSATSLPLRRRDCFLLFSVNALPMSIVKFTSDARTTTNFPIYLSRKKPFELVIFHLHTSDVRSE